MGPSPDLELLGLQLRPKSLRDNRSEALSVDQTVYEHDGMMAEIVQMSLAPRLSVFQNATAKRG